MGWSFIFASQKEVYYRRGSYIHIECSKAVVGIFIRELVLMQAVVYSGGSPTVGNTLELGNNIAWKQASC